MTMMWSTTTTEWSPIDPETQRRLECKEKLYNRTISPPADAQGKKYMLYNFCFTLYFDILMPPKHN